MTIDPYVLRLTRLRAVVADAGLDAVLISQPENRTYLSGFTGSAGWLLVLADAALFATDFRYYEQVGLECPDFELVKLPAGLQEALPGLVERIGGRKLGFEADHATFAEVEEWRTGLTACEWVPTKGLTRDLRAVKDGAEVTLIRAAVKIADEALAAALAEVRPGMRERDLSWLIESYMHARGADGPAFETIVACGPNGARPHARVSDAPLTLGEPIVIDMGARLGGYCSDLTRTVCLGQPADPGRFWEIYNTVLRAQIAAQSAVRPGMGGLQIDGIARDAITEAGYGEQFGHGLGHGVGLAVHEEPRLARTNATEALVPGHVVTVEPGIYLPGWGGVRIEDIILVTDDGAEVLTTAPKDPIISIS